MGRAAAAALAGLAHWSGGDLEAAADGYAEAVAGMEAAGNLADVLGCSLGLADMRTAQGRLRDALSTLEHGLQLAADPVGPTLRGTVDMHVALAEVLYERNDLDAVRRHLDAADELGEHAGLPQSPYRWRVAMARLAQLEGDDDGALELLDEAEQRFNTDYSPAVRPVPAMKARLRLASGDVGGRPALGDRPAAQPRRRAQLPPRVRAPHPGPGAPGRRLTSTRATRLLERLLAAAEEGGRTGSVIEVLVLLARTQHARGDEPRRWRRSSGRWPWPSPRATSGCSWTRAPRWSRLLEAAAQQGSDARPPPPGPGRRGPAVRQPSPAWSTRSATGSWRSSGCCARELSGPEIAGQLFVSLNTMRTHTKSIYTKLGVNSRRAAVRRADELGL